MLFTVRLSSLEVQTGSELAGWHASFERNLCNTNTDVFNKTSKVILIHILLKTSVNF